MSVYRDVLQAMCGISLIGWRAIQDYSRSRGEAFVASFCAGLKMLCRKLVRRGELLRNARVYFGKPIRWLVLHSFELNEECSC